LHSVLQVEQSCKSCLSLQAREQQLSAYITEFSSHSIHISSMTDMICLLDLM